MSLPLRCLFLIGLLFVDLTDDVCALAMSSIQVEPPLLSTQQATLTTFRYRDQCVEQIERAFELFFASAPSSGTRLLRWAGLALDEAAQAIVPFANRLYVLMSLQR